ncbi:MAG: hypothetical protein QXL01_00105 [Thermoplasmatales archaeon]
MDTPVYFKTKEEADKHYEYCNPPGGRPDLSASAPRPVRLVDHETKEEFDGWVVYVRSWSLD